MVLPRVVLVAFDDVQTLDVTGPAEVFAAAGRSAGEPVYDVVVASVGGGLRRTTSGLRIETRELRRLRTKPTDTVMVAGGDARAVGRAMADPGLVDWLRRAAGRARRVASVCSGAFVLAAAGLLDGKRATTHWSGAEQLARMFPEVDVDANAIFVCDGRTWTSAGVTTGIDMALAMVEDDLGRDVADAVAARLVLYVRRPGFQSQFSDALVAQSGGTDTLGAAIAWARAHLAEASVESMAKRAGMSVRTFYRRCEEQLGTTPARLVDKLRVEHARTLLTTEAVPLDSLAAQCGFSGPATLRRAFERELGVGPRQYRLLHAAG